MAFVKKAAPLVMLAAGQYFVIVSGEFDLSVGSLVGAQVVIAAKLLDGEDRPDLAGAAGDARASACRRAGQRPGHHAC